MWVFSALSERWGTTKSVKWSGMGLLVDVGWVRHRLYRSLSYSSCVSHKSSILYVIKVCQNYIGLKRNSHPFLLPQQDRPRQYSSQIYLCVAGRDSKDKTLSTMCLSSYGSRATLYLGVDADIHYICVRLGTLCVQLERLGTRRAQFSYSKYTGALPWARPPKIHFMTTW